MHSTYILSSSRSNLKKTSACICIDNQMVTGGSIHFNFPHQLLSTTRFVFQMQATVLVTFSSSFFLFFHSFRIIEFIFAHRNNRARYCVVFFSVACQSNSMPAVEDAKMITRWERSCAIPKKFYKYNMKICFRSCCCV